MGNNDCVCGGTIRYGPIGNVLFFRFLSLLFIGKSAGGTIDSCYYLSGIAGFCLCTGRRTSSLHSVHVGRSH